MEAARYPDFVGRCSVTRNIVKSVARAVRSCKKGLKRVTVGGAIWGIQIYDTWAYFGKQNTRAMAISGENDSMRFTSTVTTLWFAILIVAVLMPVQPSKAAKPYCPNPAHAKPGKVPADLIGAVTKIFQIDNSSARNVAFVRCVGPKLMGCYIGANLDCDKADKSRTLSGATAWCRENPGSKIIPMSATGHDTIYEWSCNGRRAVAGPAIKTVDSQGYIAENWKEIH